MRLSLYKMSCARCFVNENQGDRSLIRGGHKVSDSHGVVTSASVGGDAAEARAQWEASCAKLHKFWGKDLVKFGMTQFCLYLCNIK